MPLKSLLEALVSHVSQAQHRAAMAGGSLFIRKEDSAKSVDKEVLRDNYLVIQALLEQNKTGIFKRTTLAQLLLDYDKFKSFDVSRALGNKMQQWVDNEAQFICNLFQELKRCRRNARDGARSPAWLATLYQYLDEGMDLAATPPSQCSSSSFSSTLGSPVYAFDFNKGVAMKFLGGQDCHVYMSSHLTIVQ